MNTYILDGHTPVEESDVLVWANWFETADRIVKKDIADVTYRGESIRKVEVSTVFLGIDHAFGRGDKPKLFETMVFGGKLDGEQDRCSTWESAEKMHELMCEKVKNSVE